jgi:hypothetical protein
MGHADNGVYRRHKHRSNVPQMNTDMRSEHVMFNDEC